MLSRKVSATLTTIMATLRGSRVRAVHKAMDGAIASRPLLCARTQDLAVLCERNLAIANACEGSFVFSLQGSAFLLDWLIASVSPSVAGKKREAFDSVRKTNFHHQILDHRSRFRSI